MIFIIKLKVSVLNINKTIFLEFLEYFEITYLKDYEIKRWNYYDNIEHITNNASKSFNNYLKDLFPKKPHFYKILLTLQKVDSLFSDDYKLRKNGALKKKIRWTDEINVLIKYYKKNEFVELWLKCLRDFKY